MVESPSVLVATVPPTVQTLSKVAVRAPALVGLPATETVQVPEEAKSAVPQPSVRIVKSPALVPPKAGAEQPVAEAVPLFVRVKVWEPVFPLTGTVPKLLVLSEKANIGAAVPVTVRPSLVVDAVPPVPQVRVKVAVKTAAEVGSAVTVTAQDELVAKALVPQASEVIVNSLELVPAKVGALQLVAFAVPVLLKVKVTALEDALTVILP